MSDAATSRVSRSIRRHLLISLLGCLVLTVGVGGWAMATTLSGAVVATGTFVVGSHVKRIQHPAGGVIGEISVREGQQVAAGDVLIRLDATQTRVNLAIISKQLDELTARLARLVAERDDLDQILFPISLASRLHVEEVATALHSEQRLFDLRQGARDGQKAQLEERIIQFEHEIKGLEAQELAHQRGLAVLESEISSLRRLLEQGLVSTQRLNALEREAASLDGQRAEAIAAQAQVAGRIAETKLEILQIDQSLKADVSRELREVQAQIGELVERKIAAEDELRRIDIRSPQAGAVHQLLFHTIGGVISPADEIMLIVPDNDDLVLESQVLAQDIDQIHVGQRAVIRLSAFSQRTTPELSGSVVHVAADLTHDERSGGSFYSVRISIPPSELARLEGLAIVPGMPAEAFIQLGERSAFSYLVKPLTDQIYRAFREE